MDVERLAWRTRSFSGGGDNGRGYVEVAPLPAGIAVRDKKDRSLAPHVYSGPAWTALLTAVGEGEVS